MREDGQLKGKKRRVTRKECEKASGGGRFHGSEMVMKRRQKENVGRWRSMAQVRGGTVQQEREEVYAASQYAASSPCMVEEWKDCEEVGPKPKEKQKASNRVVCDRKQVSVYEMRKK